MLTLAIETSSRRGSVALLQGAQLLSEHEFPEGFSHGRDAAGAAARLFEADGRSAGELTGIAVGVGPGSYTGVRVGVTTAKALAFALRVPVVPESSLRVMAGGVPPGEPRWVATVLDGRQAFLYGALFRVQPAAESSSAAGACRVEQRLPQWVGEASELAAAFERKAAGAPVDVIGSGADVFLERVAARAAAAPSLRRGSPEWDHPAARVLGALTADSLRKARFDAEQVHRLEPNYLRATEAERRKMGEEDEGRR